MTKSRTTKIAVVALMAAGLAGAALAQGAGADAIAARQAFMKSTGASVAAAKMGDAAAAQKLADGFHKLPAMFPAGSDSAAGKTRAKAEVWSDAAGFKAASDKSGAAADALVAAVKGGDAAAIAAAATGVQQTCGGCHGAYRGPPVP